MSGRRDAGEFSKMSVIQISKCGPVMTYFPNAGIYLN
jgi:hypothetical protein